MSSTKRGGARSPHESYPTPHWVLARLLDKQVLPVGNWLDAGAGAGALIEATSAHPAYGPKVRWTASEVNAEHASTLHLLTGRTPLIGNFCTTPLPTTPFDVVISNPPFSLATEFLHVARQHATNVCFLLRLNYLSGAERSLWLTADCPDVYVIPDRPSFTPDGQTDSTSYAWMVWHGYHLGKRASGRVEVLASTPSEVRNPKSTEKRPRKPKTPKAATTGDTDAGQGREETGPPDAQDVRGSGTGDSEAGG
jgi:hypothetical protein